MRIHVQDGRTRKFLQGMNSWGAGTTNARNFPTSMEAFRHCVEQGFVGVNIVVELGLHRAPLIIPVDADRTAATTPQAVAAR